MKVKQSMKKLLITIIAIIMTSNFILPNYSHAIDSKLGKPLAAFFTLLGDSVINGLQSGFLKNQAVFEYKNNDGWFGTTLFGSTTVSVDIQYSVANIVAGNIPAFDINFFGEGNTITYTRKNPLEALLNLLAGTVADAISVAILGGINNVAETYGIDSQEMKDLEENMKTSAEENGSQNASNLKFDNLVDEKYLTQEYKDAKNNR